MTALDFRELILSLIRKYENAYKGSLEEYLRSLLVSISKYESETPSYSLFALTLEEGFRVNSLPFDKGWFGYTKPPRNRLQQSVFQAKSKAHGWNLPSPKPEEDLEILSDFRSLRRTIQFQSQSYEGLKRRSQKNTANMPSM